MKKIVLLLLTALAAVPLRAAGLMTNVIDTPTAEVVDHYGYDVNFRFYSGGGVLNKNTFGVFPRLNVGFGLDMEQLVGSDTVDLNRPTLNVKFRFYNGQRNLPALAIGYDGQGLFYDDDADEYSQREKGLFLVGSGEIFIPKLALNGGLNVFDFHDDSLRGFVGLTYTIQDRVALMAEDDNLGGGRFHRVNGGVRLYVTPSFSIDLMARDLGAAGRDEERVVRLGYFGSF